MSAWPTIPFRDTGTWLSGGTPKRDEPAFWGGSLPWIGTKDLKSFDLVGSSECVTEVGAEAGSRVVDPGAVLFVTRGMSLAKEFRVGVAACRLAFNQDVKAIVPRRDLNSRFLAWFLRAKEPFILDKCDTATHGTKRLPLERIETLSVPLPPLAEQRRVAALLDEADALRRKRRESLALLDDLLRATFVDMFGDPVTNPRGHPLVSLADVIASIEAGWSASGLDRPAVEGEWGVLKISAVTSGTFRPSENKAVLDPTFSKPPVVPQRGDLLFSRANTRDLVAATCLVENDASRVFLPDKLWRLRCHANRADETWLRFLLANPAYRARVAQCATGTSGSMLNVSQDKLLGMVAPLPPVDLQHRFRELAWRTFDQRDQYVRSAMAADELFAALLDHSFCLAA